MVLTIILVLAGLLLTGIMAANRAVSRARCQTEITNMMMALQEYFNQFSDYPPGGTDSQDDGNLDNNPGDDLGAGRILGNQIQHHLAETDVGVGQA